MELRDERHRLFGLLADPSTVPAFFARVADDVHWTVQGTHQLAGHYTDKAAFVAATFDRLGPLMRDGTHLQVGDLAVDGETVVVELLTSSITLDGAPYENHLCWVCRFESAEPGAPIVAVRAYLDSAMVSWTVARNEQLLAARSTTV